MLRSKATIQHLVNEFSIASMWNHLGSSSVIETPFSEMGSLLAECEAPGYMSELKPHFWMQNAGLEGRIAAAEQPPCSPIPDVRRVSIFTIQRLVSSATRSFSSSDAWLGFHGGR